MLPPALPKVDFPFSFRVKLRERVSALGGHLNAGPAGAGTWRLAARIPHSADIAPNSNPK
jgi:hypothetical protein